MNRDELIDPALKILRDRGVEVGLSAVYRSDMGAVLDFVTPLIEADLRERLAGEIEAMQPDVPDDPRTETVDAFTFIKARTHAARIVRGATTDPAPEGEQ